MSSDYRQYIDGEWVDAADAGTWDVVDPATEEIVATVPYGGAEDARRAVAAAARAFPPWASRTPYERGAILLEAARTIRARADALARVTARESGKPLAQARGEWLVAAELFEWFAEEGKRAYGRTIPSRRPSKRMFVLRQPIGVVGVITAWNFPAYNPSRAWAAALAAGCTVVAKPSEYTPLTAMEIVRILAEAGVPRGVVNLVNGEPAAIGRVFLEEPDCRKVSFTGSLRVGKILMEGASKTVTRLSLELGGNAPVLVFPDADLEALARTAVAAKFRNAGQVCIAPQRFFVHRSVADELTERIVAEARHLRLGPGTDPEADVGPLINRPQLERVERLVADARERGAAILLGGRRPPGRERGFFYEPTVVGAVAPEAALLREEVFGPVLPVGSFDEVDEAIARANDTHYGLAAYVWTRDLRTAVRCYEGLEFGMVGVNEWAPHGTEAPFGGWKQSGLGRESGREGLEEYLETKLVSLGGL